MSVGPPKWWLLNRMVQLTNNTLGIIERSDKKVLGNILNNDNTISGSNSFTGDNTFEGNCSFTDVVIDGNLSGNTQLNIQSNVVINGETTFNGNIISNNILNMESNVSISNSLTVNDASTFNQTLNVKNGGITLGNTSTFNGNVIFNGNVRFDGGITETFREVITANANYIVLNANIREQSFDFTYPAGIVIETHDEIHPRGYLFFDLSADRFWDLSGDNLSGNILQANTLRGNIIESSGTDKITFNNNIEVPLLFGNVSGNTATFSDNVNGNIGTFSHSISTAELTVSDKLIANNNNYFNIGDYISKHYKVINTSTVQNKGGFNIDDLKSDQNKIEQIFNTSKFFTLSHPIKTDIGHWTTGIDLNILSSGYGTGIMQDYQNFKFAVSCRVEGNTVTPLNNKNSNTFPSQYDVSFSFQGQDPQIIHIKLFKAWDINFYFIGRWRKAIDNNGNVVDEDRYEFDIAIFNSVTTNGNFISNIRYVLDMTISKSSEYTTITI